MTAKKKPATTAAAEAPEREVDLVGLLVDLRALARAFAGDQKIEGDPFALVEAGAAALVAVARLDPRLADLAEAYAGALDRYRKKAAPTLNKTFDLERPGTARPAWTDSELQVDGQAWNAGTFAWQAYVAGLRAGRSERATCEAIAARLGLEWQTVRLQMRATRRLIERASPELLADLPRPARPGTEDQAIEAAINKAIGDPSKRPSAL